MIMCWNVYLVKAKTPTLNMPLVTKCKFAHITCVTSTSWLYMMLQFSFHAKTSIAACSHWLNEQCNLAHFAVSIFYLLGSLFHLDYLQKCKYWRICLNLFPARVLPNAGGSTSWWVEQYSASFPLFVSSAITGHTWLFQ